MKVKLRCSKLPLFALCAGSGIPVRNQILEAEPEFNDPSNLGTAVHEPLALMVMSDDAEPDLSAIAADRNVDTDDLAQLYFYGKRCWPMLKEHFGEKPIAEEYFEREFPTFILSGHPDIKSDPIMDIIAGADWKSGRVEYNAAWQLYGLRPLCGVELGVIVWLRETWSGEPFEVIEIPPEKEIIAKLTAQVEKMHKGECVTGPHCNTMYCERTHECTAYRRFTRHALSPLLKAAHSTGILTRETLVEAYYALKPIKEAVKLFEAYLNDRLDSEGEIEIDPGETKLVRMTTHPKSFDAHLALAVMEEYGVAEPAKCFKVSVKKLAKAIADTAASAGAKKGAHYVEFLERCEEVGALHYGTRRMRKELRLLGKPVDSA